MRAVRGWLGAWSLAAVVLAGCGGSDDNGFSPSVATVAGTYNASKFTATSSSGTVNLLSLGATVHVVLNPDGTTTGHLSVPDVLGTGPIDADLAGTWTLSGSTVTFSPNDPNSIIGDADFTAAQNSLEGDGTFEGTTLHLALAKTG
ncbi:MAG TPA: hypothetical protein VIQ25_18710 [Gemmatimonadales bacterium]